MNMQSDAIGQLADALAKAQGEMKAVTKGRTAKIVGPKGSYSYTYADLSDVIETSRAVLAQHQLAVVQSYDTTADGIFLITTLVHNSGEWMRSMLPVANTGGKPQELGSAMTYMRRYAYTALIGVAAEEDDDGAAAHDTPKRAAPKAANTPPPQPTEASPEAAEAFVTALRVKLSKCREPADVDTIVKANATALQRLHATFPDLWEQAEGAVSDVRLELQNDPVRMRAAG